MDYKSLKSGTDIRGVACEGAGFDVNLTDEVIGRIAAGFLCWCERHLSKKSCELKIALGHDSRVSAGRISNAIIKALTDFGVTVLDCGLASTPAMFMAVVDIPCDCSIQITASHHPWFRNGLKFFTASGGLDSPDIDEILSYAENDEKPALTECGAIQEIDFMKRYSEILREKIKAGINSSNYEKPLESFKIVVDAGNGAGGFYATDVLAPLGADVSGSVFLEPDGMFPNHIPNPEDKSAMAAVTKATLSANADLGIIFDTDVDRGGAVDKSGKEIARNRLVAIASTIALEGNAGGTVVTDSITSDGLKAFIEDNLGGKHHRFKRGYKNVINEAVRLNNEGINSPLAIETSGHAAFRENYFLDDGAYLVTKMIIKLAQLKQNGQGFEDILSPLQEAAEEAELRLPIIEEDFRKCGSKVISDLAVYAERSGWTIAPDNREGIRISFPKDSGDGWFLLRLSVHDPIMPLNIESNTAAGTKVIAEKLLGFFKGKSSYAQGIDFTPLKKYIEV